MSGSNRVAWFVFGLLAISIGLYPISYLFIDSSYGFLSQKPAELVINILWKIGFYGHITFGGIALLVGWSQFSVRLRKKRLALHRNLGKIYVTTAVISGVCGFAIGPFATGGLVSALGFMALGAIWLYTTYKAYIAVKKKDIDLHQGMMVYSYAACFAAVTLRIYLPILILIFGEFLIAYKIVAWMCWVPNIAFAFYWVRRKGLQIG
ncbi:hypothetical protein GCM10011414_26370 [Croceivirga lutea]|uniref:DUF2306 domain-containing protein n=1 Tax=Croceivirga lutea TaxID=1775167 RepID=UPI00163B2D38|nr:DUF2306 domain-containing protein [Croceivirga lutea]GGG55237.1 hypothetical protein GCM10011414_26370 [Croceivirga lutea]